MNKETEQPEVHVKVRSYGLTELGLLYNPSLQQSGWRKGQRKFTPLQTQQIFRFLGEP